MWKIKMRTFFRQFEERIDLVGAEIGVKSGENASIILKSLKIKNLILVDSWKAYKNFDLTKDEVDAGYGSQKMMDENRDITYKLFGTDKRVIIMAVDSILAADICQHSDRLFDFVYIDANHRRKDVLNDCIAWYPVIKRGGVIGGHDFNNEVCGDQIKLAVMDFMEYTGKPPTDYVVGGDDWWVIKTT
jgi:hypothetical protein